MPEVMNGQAAPPASREQIEERLVGEPLTIGYKPTLPLWALWSTEAIPQFFLMRDVEMMMIHPHVRNCLDNYKSGIAIADFWGGPSPDGDPDGLPICADNPEVDAFVREQCNRFWDRGVPKVQGGYEYGWIGGEHVYHDHGQGLEWEDLIQFSPRDVFLLTQKSIPVGVRVKSIQPTDADRQVKVGAGGYVDLWMASEDVPAKALWYAHNPRFNPWYGQSQLLGAWRPWRRLAWKQGAETVIDGGFFRYAYSGPKVGYPEGDARAANAAPGTTLDSQGAPRRYNRDIARQMAEQAQAGAAIGMPTTKYPDGGDMWTLDWAGNEFDGGPLIAYIKYLHDSIASGIGVPVELLQAQEGGSGYSGRAIPMEAFLAGQQRVADAILRLFLVEVLRPLVRWRYGAGIKFDVKVRPLLQTKRKLQQGDPTESKEDPNEVNPGLPPPMPGHHQANSHHPLVGQSPPPGQADRGPGPQSPFTGRDLPFSIGTGTRVEQLARFIRSMGGKAA